jgi:hypothetical protein
VAEGLDGLKQGLKSSRGDDGRLGALGSGIGLRRRGWGACFTH